MKMGVSGDSEACLDILNTMSGRKQANYRNMMIEFGKYATQSGKGERIETIAINYI